MSISPEDAHEREDSPASSLIGGSEEESSRSTRSCRARIRRLHRPKDPWSRQRDPFLRAEFLLAQYCATTGEAAHCRGHRERPSHPRQALTSTADRGFIKVPHLRSRTIPNHRQGIRQPRRHARPVQRLLRNLVTNAQYPTATVRENDRLLTGGVWCMADVSYVSTGDTGAKASSPWVVSAFKPSIATLRFDAIAGAPRSAPTSDRLYCRLVGSTPRSLQSALETLPADPPHSLRRTQLQPVELNL